MHCKPLWINTSAKCIKVNSLPSCKAVFQHHCICWWTDCSNWMRLNPGTERESERETQRGLLLSPVMIDVEVHYSVLDMTSVIELHHSHLRQHGLPKRDKWVPCSLTKKPLSLFLSHTHTHTQSRSLSLFRWSALVIIDSNDCCLLLWVNVSLSQLYL